MSEIYTLLRKYGNSGEERSIFYKEQVLLHKTFPVTCSTAFTLKSLKFSKTLIFNYLLIDLMLLYVSIDDGSKTPTTTPAPATSVPTPQPTAIATTSK